MFKKMDEMIENFTRKLEYTFLEQQTLNSNTIPRRNSWFQGWGRESIRSAWESCARKTTQQLKKKKNDLLIQNKIPVSHKIMLRETNLKTK